MPHIIFVLAPLIPVFFFVSTCLSSDRVVDNVNVAGGVSLIVSGLSLYSIYVYMGQPRIVIHILSVKGVGEVYGLLIDPLSMIFATIISVVGGCIMLYSTDYMSPRNAFHPVLSGKVRFYAWMYLFIASAMLFVMSTNLIEILINFELMSLACWGLISYYGSDEAVKASYKMLVTTHLGAYGGLAVAIGYLIAKCGSTELTALSHLSDYGKLLILSLAMWAAITKSAQFPTYSWLPDAMVAPTPTSALLHGATMIEMGPYLMARIIYSMGRVPASSALAILVPAIASLGISTAMYPLLKDGKRVLAYSTISEVAIMYFAVAISVYSLPLGLALFTIHFIVHAFLKSIGFLTFGYAGFARGSFLLKEIMSVVKSSRFLLNAYLLSLLGLAGAPIYGISKIYVLVKCALAKVILNPAYLIAYVSILVESLILLVVATRWFNRAFESVTTQAVLREARAKYMVTSIAILMVFLYVFQACFFIYVKPALTMVR